MKEEQCDPGYMCIDNRRLGPYCVLASAVANWQCGEGNAVYNSNPYGNSQAAVDGANVQHSVAGNTNNSPLRTWVDNPAASAQNNPSRGR